MDVFNEQSKNYEKLFLFEFYVDHVGVYESKLNLDKNTLKILGPLAIRFQFLDYPPIEVYEESFAVGTKPLIENKNIYLKSGKSCVFSLSALKSKKVMDKSNFDVFLTVYKYKLQRYAPGSAPQKPEDVFLGRTMIDIGDLFKDLYGTNTSEKLTRSKTGLNRLVDADGNLVGKILFMIRVSCFGFMVMTAFELPPKEQEDFKYKHIEYDKPSPVEPDLPPRGSVDKKQPGPCGEVEETLKEKTKEKCKDKEKKKDRKKRDKKKKDTKKDVASAEPTCPFGYQACCCPCRAQQTQFPGTLSDPTGYQMGYNAVGGQYQQGAPSVSSAQQNGPNRARDIDIDPGAVGIRGNQLVFKMPENQAAPSAPVEGKFASSVYYKMEDETQNGARNVIQIQPKNPISDVDPSKVDEKQDVLVLKLGKKRISQGKKPKLELELRTPKMKEDKPPTDTKDTQYLETDCPKPPKSPKPSKGGKAKSVKGGKGKKKK